MRFRPLFVLFFICFLAWAPNSHGFSFNNPIVDAVDVGDEAKVRSLLKAGKSPDSTGDFGVTPLMRAAFRGNINIIQILLESGAYVNCADVGGDTPLHLAARNGHADAVEMLLSYGAFIDVTDKEKWTPLMRAVMAKKSDVAKVLIDRGANLAAVNEMDESVLVHASMIGQEDIMKMIVGSPGAKKIKEDQRLAAMEVAEKKNEENIGHMLVALVAENKNNVASGVPSSLAYDKYAVKLREGSSTLPSSLPSSSAKAAALSPLSDDKYSKQNYANNSSAPIDLWQSKPTQPKTAVPNVSSYANNESWGQWGGGQSASSSAPVPEPVIKTAIQPDKSVPTKTTPAYTATKAISAPSAIPVNDINQLYTLYLGSFETNAKANEAWSNLMTQNSDVLAKFTPIVASRQIPENKTVIYNLQAGQFNMKDIAESNCSSLRSRNVKCFVMPMSEIAKTQYADNSSTYKPAANYNSSYVPAARTTSSSGYTPGIDELPWLQQQQANNYEDGYAEQNYPANTANNNNYEQQKEFFNNMVESSPSKGNKAPTSNASPKQLAANFDSHVPPKNMSDEDVRKEVRDMTRKKFFKEQGIAEPEMNKNYEDFYKEIENKNNKNSSVSEAVLVPDETYFAGVKSSGGKVWITVASFFDKKAADDYSERMFKSDESLNTLQIMMVDTPTPTGSVYSIKVGPLPDSKQASNICGIVKSSGMSCKIDGADGATNYAESSDVSAPSTSSYQSTSNNYWINLGTFADEPEAEYYWMFLQEDHEDILKTLQYTMAPPGKNNNFGKDAVQLKAGPFYTKSRADQLCNILRYRNVACLVQ